MTQSPEKPTIKRRTFIKTASAGVLALSQSPLLWGTESRWRGANDRVRLAIIGIHGMGQNHIEAFSRLKNVEIAALCDVDENLFPEVIDKHFTKRGKPAPKTYVDMRKLYEDKTIDAVSIVTPNHWHALAAIWAIQAGKHVTVEKPCCHNIYEGRKLVEAAEKYNVVVQDGAEQRSSAAAQSMAEFLHSGELGEVYLAKGLCYKRRGDIGHTPDEPVPTGVNYDLWLGPAPERPFSKNRFHYNWHWNWDYGNGDIGNQGVHEIDIARWGLGVKLPTRISAMGGHMMFDDDQETPNVLMAVFEFPNPEGGGDKKKIMQFEVRNWFTNGEGSMAPDSASQQTTDYKFVPGSNIGNLFYGSKGYMVKNAGHWTTQMGDQRGPSGKGGGDHAQNFIEAIRKGEKLKDRGNIREGFYSCSLIHLANISYRLGRTLDFDPETMTFPHDEAANAMLTRDYRKPFVVPDQV